MHWLMLLLHHTAPRRSSCLAIRKQLENVTPRCSPPEIEVSVLGYWLGEHKVIPDDRDCSLKSPIAWLLMP